MHLHGFPAYMSALMLLCAVICRDKGLRSFFIVSLIFFVLIGQL